MVLGYLSKKLFGCEGPESAELPIEEEAKPLFAFRVHVGVRK